MLEYSMVIIMIKAIFFDLDGTLINSLDDLADGVNHTLAEYGFPTHQTEKYKYFVGDGMRKLIERTIPEIHRNTEIHNKVLEDFMSYYRAHSLIKTAPYSDVYALLDSLCEMGVESIIVTNKAHAAAEKISNHFFGERIKRVYGQLDGIPTKPDPKIICLALEELSLKPEECLFVGDSGMDMKAGVNSGITPVGVTWGFRTKEELVENGAKYIIDAPSELLGLVK